MTAYSKTLPSLESATLASDAATALRRAILSGTFTPGERLLEGDIADQLHVSRATVREATRILIGEGLLVHNPRKGTHVVRLAPKDIEEIYEMRLALESVAVSKLCLHLPGEQESHLRSLIDAMRRFPPQGTDTELFDLDMRFHEALCRFSGNRRLAEAWMHLGGHLRIYFAASGRKYTLEDFPRSHQEILDAILAKDQKVMVSVLEDHITEGKDRMLPDFAIEGPNQS